MSEFEDSFRRVINQCDPMANSLMSKDNPPAVKILADWGRKSCDELAAQAKEIATLRNQIIDMNIAITGWREGLAYNSEAELITELERMIKEALAGE